MENLSISKRIALICQTVRKTGKMTSKSIVISSEAESMINELSAAYHVSSSTIKNILTAS